MTQRRVNPFHYEIASEVVEAAKDAGDQLVIAVCRRVRQAFLLGKRVQGADLDLIVEFAGQVRA